MASVGMQLLSHVIRTGKLTEVLDWGITKDDMLTAEERSMHDMLLGYQAEYGAVLGPNLLQVKFPTFELVDDGIQMTTQALCAEVRKARLRRDAKALGLSLAEQAELDPLAALSSSQSAISNLVHLGMSKKTDVHFADAMKEIVSDYEMQEQGLLLPRLYWPWSLMNDMTGGISEEDYIILYGRPKSMKSWVLCYMIAMAFLTHKRVLVYTKEMTPKNIYKRVAACVGSLPYQELRTAKLSAEQREELLLVRDGALALRDSQAFVCLSGKDVQAGGDTIPWVRSKIEKYKPDVVYVDGLYLMSSDGGRKNQQTNERVENISRAARQMVLDTGVPLVATMQANRKAAAHQQAELDEVALSDAASQDATLLARIINEKHEHPTFGQTIAFLIAGSREFRLHGFRLGGTPATDFSYKEIMTEKDIERAKEGDSKHEEPDAEGEHAKKRPQPTPSNKGKSMSGTVDKNIDQQFKSLRT